MRFAHIVRRTQLLFQFFLYVFIWFSIICHYFCQCFKCKLNLIHISWTWKETHVNFFLHIHVDGILIIKKNEIIIKMEVVIKERWEIIINEVVKKKKQLLRKKLKQLSLKMNEVVISSNCLWNGPWTNPIQGIPKNTLCTSFDYSSPKITSSNLERPYYRFCKGGLISS